VRKMTLFMGGRKGGRSRCRINFFKTKGDEKMKSIGGYMWIDGVRLREDIIEAKKTVDAFLEPHGLNKGDTIYYDRL